ncbi:MAG: hypothetical protein EOS21_31810 [Mesorhizobium sp.]|nr:MAG: hypothetical protein EOS21_31810 [Mesorhizobium sp.]
MLANKLIQCTLFCILASPGFPSAQENSKGSAILNVSPFMMPPRQTWAPLADSADPNAAVTEMNASSGDLGFRVIHLRKSVQGKKQAAVDLAQSKLVQTGDILLSFRPLWDKTLAYAHMQLGVSHSAIAFIVSEGSDELVMTLESPISYSSPLNSPEHYADLDAIHIVRPELEEAQKRNLEKWARLIMSSPSRFGFFTDYSMPMYKRGLPGISTPHDEIRLLADVALGNTNSTFQSYCSEFVWNLLGLRNCDPAVFDQDCIKPIFSTSDGMMTGIIPKVSGNAGLVQGPEATLIGGLIGDSEKTAMLTKSVFVDVLTDPSQLAGRMSAGHLKVAEANKGNMAVVNGYYGSGEPEALAAEINKSVIGNVSPTSFLIRSNAGMDGFRYVGTVVFDR